MKPWCIRHRTGWCRAAKQDVKPDEAATSIKTACGFFISLPWGIERRTPTCSDPGCKSPRENRA